MSWNEVTEWERSWWGKCTNTYGEEEKQLLYLNRMGFVGFHNNKSPYNFDLGGLSVLDIGGGPTSVLLKFVNFKGTVADPCDYPQWVADRYALAGIEYIKQKGEDLDVSKFYDVVMIYNVLQHTEDPHKIIENALKISKMIKIFEWVNMGTNEGHPHSFTDTQLDSWLKGYGKVEHLDGIANCTGDCYYGTFKGERFG
jgi:2-polyprenyl-3-methyl-5-hydroxy-6-metoxy-1,4-benzoquinol methylase